MAPREPDDTTGFQIIPESELKFLPPLTWLVEGMIPAAGLGMIFGDYGTGKTFLSLDLAFSVACNLNWLGQPVKQGSAIYVAAEGVGGLNNRIQAWKTAHGISVPVDCGFIIQPVTLLGKETPEILVSSIQKFSSNPALVIIDTLARCIPGADENLFKEMSRVVLASDIIREKTGATVFIVHHSPKGNKRTARGSGALEGAADAIFCLSKSNGTITLNCEKQKDAAHFDPIKLKLKTIDLGDGETSCVIEETKTCAEPTDQMTAMHETALNILFDFGPNGPTSGKWQEKFRERTSKGEKTYYRSRDWLAENKYVQVEGGKPGKGKSYTLTEKGRNAVTVK